MCICRSYWHAALSLLLCFSIILMPIQQAQAQAMVSYDGARVTNAVQAAIKSVVGAKYGVNSAQVGATAQAISNTAKATLSGAAGAAKVGGLAALAGAALGGPITWAGIASAIIYGSLSAGAGALIASGLNWAFNSDGTVSVTGMNPVANSPGWAVADKVWTFTSNTPNANGQTYYSKDASQILNTAFENFKRRVGPAYKFTEYGNCKTLDNGNAFACDLIEENPTYNVYNAFMLMSVNSPVACPPNTIYTGSCTKAPGNAGTPGTPGQGPAQVQSLPQAIDNLTPEQKAQTLTPETVANIANNVWQQTAAQPGYKGEAYPQERPISATDIAKMYAVNPAVAPRLGDLVQPSSSPSTFGADPFQTIQPQNTTTTNTTTGDTTSTSNMNVTYNVTNNTKEEQKIDFGDDPGIATPGLDDTPSGESIFGPILGLLPDFKNWQMPAYAGACPTATFDILGKSVTMDSHCSLFEQNEGVIRSVFVAMWTFSAILIVLGA